MGSVAQWTQCTVQPGTGDSSITTMAAHCALLLQCVVLCWLPICLGDRVLGRLEGRQVTYSGELESLLREASQGRGGGLARVRDLLLGEIESTEDQVRRRTFFYLEEEVSRRGEDITSTRFVIENMKSAMEESLDELEAAKEEISQHLDRTQEGDKEQGDTWVQVLSYIRGLGEQGEERLVRAAQPRV